MDDIDDFQNEMKGKNRHSTVNLDIDEDDTVIKNHFYFSVVNLLLYIAKIQRCLQGLFRR